MRLNTSVNIDMTVRCLTWDWDSWAASPRLLLAEMQWKAEFSLGEKQLSLPLLLLPLLPTWKLRVRRTWLLFPRCCCCCWARLSVENFLWSALAAVVAAAGWAGRQ